MRNEQQISIAEPINHSQQTPVVNSPKPVNWVRSGSLTLLEKGCGLVFSLGTLMLLSRAVTKETFATWGLFLLVTYFIEVARNGLIMNGLVRYLTVHRDQRATYVAIASSSLALNLGFSITTNALLWLGSDWLAQTYQAPQLKEVLPIYFVANLLTAFLFHFNFVQQANFEFRGIFWSTFFYRGALLFWVATCRFMSWPVQLHQLAASLLTGALMGASGSWFYARRFMEHRFQLSFQWIKRLVSFGKFVLGTNMSTMFYKSFDKLALGQLLGPAAFALYDVAGKVTQMVEAPSFSIATVVFPQSADRMVREGAAGVKRLYERSVGAVLAVILPFLIAIVLFAEPVVRLLAGEQYLESANILRITAFLGLFMPYAVQFGTILDSTGRPATNFAFTLLTAGMNFILSFTFVWKFGLYGAPVATLTGYALSFVLMQRLLRRDFGVVWWEAFRYVPEVYRIGWKVFRLKLGI